MSKVDLSQFKRDMAKVFEEIAKPDSLLEIGKFAADRIVKRTRLGRGVAEPEGEAAPLKPLSEAYVEARKREREAGRGKGGRFVKGAGKLSSLTSPKKSNLTRTDQMLSSIKPERPKRGSVTITPTGTRKEGSLTNEEVAGYVSRERPFLNLSKAEVAGVTRLIRERIDEILQRLGLTGSR